MDLKDTLIEKTDSYIYNVMEENFQEKVMDASNQTPILLDCHAPWCEPCKQLMPELENVIKSHNGAIKLAKLDIEANKKLASQMQVKSVPAVIVVFQGKPIDSFQGVIPKSELIHFVNSVIEKTGTTVPNNEEETQDISQLLSDAENAVAKGNYDIALPLWIQILEVQPTSTLATAELAKCYINIGETEAAQNLLDASEYQDNYDIKSAMQLLGLSLIANKLGETEGLKSAYENNTNDLNAGVIYAQSLFGKGEHEDAVELLLSLYTKDRDWNDNLIKAELLKCFEALGFENYISISGRKKLSSLMFI